MSAKSPRKAALVLVSAVFAVASAGCGSKPPCQTDIAAVDAARSAAKAAEAKLDEAERQQADLQRQIEAEEARQDELKQRKEELKAQIAELGG